MIKKACFPGGKQAFFIIFRVILLNNLPYYSYYITISEEYVQYEYWLLFNDAVTRFRFSKSMMLTMRE